MRAGDRFRGYRLQPGAEIDAKGLLAALGDGPSEEAVCERIGHHVTLDNGVSEALDCLASGVTSVAQGAAALGVGTRSLQRHLLARTRRSPGYWLRLARVRRAASEAARTPSLTELAYRQGYSDQAHMTRDFRRWLGTTPGRIAADPNWIARHFERGYAV